MGFVEGVKNKVTQVLEIYDLNEYNDICDMEGYVGFITPQGTFYRVRKFGGNEQFTHGDWAMHFLAKHPPKQVLNYDCTYVCSEEFNFAMIFESGDRSSLYFQCGEGGLTPNQVQVINALNKYTVLKDFSEPEDSIAR